MLNLSSLSKKYQEIHVLWNKVANTYYHDSFRMGATYFWLISRRPRDLVGDIWILSTEKMVQKIHNSPTQYTFLWKLLQHMMSLVIIFLLTWSIELLLSHLWKVETHGMLMKNRHTSAWIMCPEASCMDLDWRSRAFLCTRNWYNGINPPNAWWRCAECTQSDKNNFACIRDWKGGTV